MVRKSKVGEAMQYTLAGTDFTAEGHPSGGWRKLSVVGLFSGIGGLELGFERAKHEVLLTCEIDPSARKVLSARFRHPIHEDIRTLDALPKETDLVVGGFPCQDLSQAGKTAGIAGAQSGLVGEVFRLLKDRDVPWVVLENVPFMLQLSRGRALDVIVASLEQLGYRWAYRVVDTRAFGLPQRRRRVLLVASKVEDPRTVLFADDAGEPDEPSFAGRACGFYWTEGIRGLGWAVDAVPTLKGGSTVGVPSPPAIWMPDGRIVTPALLDAERLQGFAADWTKPAERAGRSSFRWKLIGNAVSVPVAKWLGARVANPGSFRVTGVRTVVEGKAWPTCAWNVGAGRFTARVSEWPKRYKRKSLAEFLLHEPKALSEKATAGFLNRVDKGSLRFPIGFKEALRRHLNAMIAERQAA